MDRWARSLHISGQVEQSLLGLKNTVKCKDVTQHKEESLSRMKSDCLDREKIRKFLATCIHPFLIEEHKHDIVNIYSGKLSTKAVNVDKLVSIGKEQVQMFISALPDGFYKSLSRRITTMNILKKSIKVDEVDIIDTSLIHSRVIAMQLTHEAMKIENVLKFELAPIPTSIFEDNGSLRPPKSKSNLKSIGTKIVVRNAEKTNFIVMDGCAIMYVVNWPTNTMVQDYVNNMCHFVLNKLKTRHSYCFRSVL